MKKIAALILLLTIAACETTSDVMKTWVGKSDTQLMSAWGAPDRAATASDGRRVLSYDARNGYGEILCRQNFTVDGSRIVAWSHNCSDW